MLSRHAESLFWLGRYLERTEYTTRVLDVTYHALLEAAAWEAEKAWWDLLRVLRLDAAFAAEGLPVSAEAVNRFVVTSPRNHNAVAASVARVRENARAVRELVPTELWHAINSFHLALAARDLDHDLAEQPYDLYEMVKQRCQTVSGVLGDTMTRDDGWRFVLVGRHLERAQMTCRLLSVRYRATEEVSFHQWIVALKSASAAEAFGKAYRGASDPRDVVAFLLLSRIFPRSIFFCLSQAESHLSELVGDARTVSRPQRLLGRTRAALEFSDLDELLRTDLSGHLDAIEDEVRRVAESVATEYFRNSQELAPHVPMGPYPGAGLR
jgi:uncharacterized alpha-E superfamily protein